MILSSVRCISEVSLLFADSFPFKSYVLHVCLISLATLLIMFVTIYEI